MNVRHIPFNINGKIEMQGNTKSNFDDTQRTAVEKLYSRAQREVCEWGNFSEVVEEFSSPSGQNYTLYIKPSPNKETPKVRILEMGIQIPNTSRMFSVEVTRGKKEEILNFLSDENNLKEISDCTKILSQRLNKE